MDLGIGVVPVRSFYKLDVNDIDLNLVENYLVKFIYDDTDNHRDFKFLTKHIHRSWQSSNQDPLDSARESHFTGQFANLLQSHNHSQVDSEQIPDSYVRLHSDIV